MRRLFRIGRRLRRDGRGATIVEFGLLILPLTVVLLVLFDFAYRMYLNSIVEGAMHGAARLATIGNQTPDQIDAYVKSQLFAFQKNATVTIDKKSYSQFSGVGKDEKYIDSNANRRYDANVDCYYDDNANGRYDYAATSGKSGLGGSDDLVYYKVTADFPRIVPLTRFLGWSADEQVTSTMVLRNQPFGSQSFPDCRK